MTDVADILVNKAFRLGMATGWGKNGVELDLLSTNLGYTPFAAGPERTTRDEYLQWCLHFKGMSDHQVGFSTAAQQQRQRQTQVSR